MASLQSPSAPAPASASQAPERPRARLDGTDADFQALAKPFYDCMKAHGQTQVKGFASGDGVPKGLAAAQKACEDLWPLPAWELDPANPQAKDFARAVVKCLREKGVAEVDTGKDGISIEAGGRRNDARSISMTGQLLLPCQREVAAKK